MSRALLIYYTGFDTAFLSLPAGIRHRIEAAIDDMGLRLAARKAHPLRSSVPAVVKLSAELPSLD